MRSTDRCLIDPAQNEENAGLIQALEEAVAARDVSIMRAVNKIKELVRSCAEAVCADSNVQF